MKKQFLYTAFLGAVLLTGGLCITACGDVDEIHELSLSRLLSPTELSARIRNSVNVELEWRAVPGAKAYTVEIYEGETAEGTAVRTIEGITTHSYTVSSLQGGTKFLIRIKATGTDINDSKWTEIAATTGDEQIFNTVDAADIAAASVTLRWNANGNPVTKIVLTPGDINHTLTETEIANQSATLTGLTELTTYTATIYNDAKARGTVTFTTLRDLGGAIQIANAEELTSALANAEDGAILALNPGTYEVAKLEVKKTLTLAALEVTQKPILKTTIIRMQAGAGLTMTNIVMDGTGSTGDQAIVYEAATDYHFGAVSIENCEFRNYTKGFFYANVKALIESISIQNCHFGDIVCSGGDFFDLRQAVSPSITFRNNIVARCATTRDLFRIDNSSASFTADALSPIVLRVENNVFYRSVGEGKRLLYLRFKDNQVYFNKNIVAQTTANKKHADTGIAEMANNDYHEAAKFVDGTDTGTVYQLDPQFADPENGNLTVGNQTLIDEQIGVQ